MGVGAGAGVDADVGVHCLRRPLEQPLIKDTPSEIAITQRIPNIEFMVGVPVL